MKEIKFRNPVKNIVVMLDNFSSHISKATVDFAEEIGIELVYLPPYSPDINPIEFIVDVDHMKKIIYGSFQKFSSKMSFAKRWMEKFLNNKLETLGS